MTEQLWSFKDTTSWGGNCNGMNQSPINIDTELVLQCKDLCDLSVSYKKSTCNAKFNNNMLSLTIDQGSYITFRNVYYKLNQITVHVPSMHTLDGEKYDMEVCLIHNTGNPEEGGITISCLYQAGAHHGEPERFFSQFINDAPSFNADFEESIHVSDTWGPEMLIPKRKAFYMYEGSLHHPPCTENYTNIVMEHVGTIGTTNLNLLKKYLTPSNRPIQPTLERKVFYNTGKNTLPTGEREVYETDDRFLRCVKDTNTTTTRGPMSSYSNFKGCYTQFPHEITPGKVASVMRCDKRAQKARAKYFALTGKDSENKFNCLIMDPAISGNQINNALSDENKSDECSLFNGISYSNSTGNFSVYEASSSDSIFGAQTKEKIRSFLFLAALILIFLNSIFFTKYLFLYGYAQAFIITIVGIEKFNVIDPNKLWEARCYNLNRGKKEEAAE